MSSLWDNLASIAKPTFILFGLIVFFYALVGPYVSVESDYLGKIDDNISYGSQEWKDWHEEKLAHSLCADKEILNTIEVCCGHVTIFCKEHWSYAYNWCEIHSMDNQCYWQWWWE